MGFFVRVKHCLVLSSRLLNRTLFFGWHLSFSIMQVALYSGHLLNRWEDNLFVIKKN